ncbi:uncharacterized protein C3orf20 homolog [Sphaerodactylus townsendi]|uniref:uncharacterized protein C3orf20 homolog n=1 Tax=Sphaerodactylus townsendi TaxID=933632 RepID=UPI002026256C|nr:uncharacterized protein C3orf20 homolog [Sphaerodactylus townsendi]
MSTRKKNPEYEHMKAKAPGILAEMANMLVAWRKMGFHVPRGVRNVFEFSWEELSMPLPRKSFSGIYCPVVKFSQLEDSFITPPKVQKPGITISGLKPTYVTPSTDDQQQMLLRFQQRSVHLLSELLKMKMKIMIDAVAGPSAEEIARRFLEGGLKLNPKSQEEAADLMTKDSKRKGGRALVPVVPAIPITSTTQLIQQMSFSCLCFSLALKDSRQSKGSGLGCSTKRRASEDVEGMLDPCPQAREKLREICRHIEQEKAIYKAKGHTKALTLRHYPILTKTPSGSLKKGASSTVLPEAKQRKKSKKFHYGFPDGTSFIFYPSGNIAIYQFPVCCTEKTITLLYHDARRSALLGTFMSYGQSCVHYAGKTSCSLALLMTQEGGTVRDQNGVLTHQWSWRSKQQVLQSLDFQINEQIKLKVLGLHSMALSFTSYGETITLSLTSAGCLHESKAEKRIFSKTSETEEDDQWTRILVDSKRRFERIVKQFVNAVLLTAGICCIDYPLGESSKQAKFKTNKPSLAHAWEWKLREESIAVSEAEGKPRAKMPVMRSPISYKFITEKPKVPSRDKAEADGETKLAGTWATSPADCPIVLRHIMAKEDEVLGCKCVVKIPSITDLELEKFIAAPREPHQILVICVLSSKNQSYSPFFEWSLEKMYIEMQHGRPSPCVQCKHDPYRLLKYDLDNPMNKKPPLLIQKHDVVPGMVVMYSGGKPIFGGCVFNGYSYSKKDFLKQVNQAHLDCQMGHFLPQNFKFSCSGWLGVGTRKVHSTVAKPSFQHFAAQRASFRKTLVECGPPLLVTWTLLSNQATAGLQPIRKEIRISDAAEDSEAFRRHKRVKQDRIKESFGDGELLDDAMKKEGERPKHASSARKKSKKQEN